MSTRFIHLHLHTEFSLVDGVVRIKPLIEQVVQAGMPAVAVTDMANLFGAVKFYKAALAAGVKPIIGADLWLQRNDEALSRLLLLCQDMTGYRNLSRLISRSYQEERQREAIIVRYDWLAGNSAGLIALSGGREGEIGRVLLHDNATQAKAYLDDWSRLFPDRFYLELQRTGRPDEAAYIQAAVDLATSTGTPVVASNDVRFLSADDFEAHEARVCINQGWGLSDPNRPRHYSEQQYLRTPTEMVALFADLPQALENSVEIAVRCNLELELGHSVLPDFPVPAGLNVAQYLEQASQTGLNQRLGVLFDTAAADFATQRKPYDERLAIELDVINQMGFPGYFLIVADFIQWAKDNGVPVGPGRGSGAGSLVAYALGITDLDPLAYDLLFERFLNPERVSMPDFDIDFCMEGRDRVIDYVADKYGRDKVSQIATHGTMAAKAVVRDVGRVLGHPYGYVDRIAKLIPFKPGVTITLEQALADEEELRKLYENDEEVRYLIDLARKLEGLSRNVGKHAGGVVISPSSLTDFSPLYCEAGSDSPATQFDKDDVEAVGLVKFDFLGLRTLTIIDWALQTVNRKRREVGEPALDISTIALDDRKAFALLKRCETTAVFQLESRGMKDLIKRLQPDRFEDIVALVALFRPGPLQSGMVDDFINRKHGRAEVAYPHPDLKPILESTYGVILYQEQVMQIAQVLANYTLGGADLLRRAMGKKKPEEMAKQREIFLSGAAERGVKAEVAAYIFDLMEKFAGYGFNKSHSAAYALVSYQTAWLKAHYPAAFMAAVLSSDMDNTDKVVIFIEECRQMKREVIPPSINRSEYRFTVDEQECIVYGLGAIKGVGENALEHILDERRRQGEFKDLDDLCQRVDLRKVNRRVLEALIRAGACDCFHSNRAGLLAQLPDALALAEQGSRASAAGQLDMFGLAGPAQAEASTTVQEGPEWSEAERLAEEKKTLGLYLTGHPISQYETELAHIITARLADVQNSDVSRPQANNGRGRGRESGKKVVLAGLVVEIRTRNANRGGRMAFVTLDDRSARLEIRVFAEVYEQFRELIREDRVLVVEGLLAYDDFSDSLRLTAERIMDIDTAREDYVRRLVLKLNQQQFNNGLGKSLLDELVGTLTPYRDGKCRISVDYTREGAKAELTFGEDWRIKPAEPLLQQLRALVGATQVELEYSRPRRSAAE